MEAIVVARSFQFLLISSMTFLGLPPSSKSIPDYYPISGGDYSSYYDYADVFGLEPRNGCILTFCANCDAPGREICGCCGIRCFFWTGNVQRGCGHDRGGCRFSCCPTNRCCSGCGQPPTGP